MSRAIVLVLSLIVAAPAAASGEELGLRFRKELDRGGAAGEAILGVPLDSDIAAATRDGFPDVRIVDDRGLETPYALETIRHAQFRDTREPCESKVVSLKVSDGKSLEVVVALDGKAPAATGMTIRSPLTDYEHKVRVFGSIDGQKWTLRVGDGLIFDYSRFMDVRNREVVLPSGGDRMLKVVIEGELDERESPFRELIRGRLEGTKDVRIDVSAVDRRPFRIDGIDLWHVVQSQSGDEPKRIAYPAQGFSVEHDAKAKVTRVIVQSRREPATALILKTATRNFSRPARLEIPSPIGRDEWVEVGRGDVFVIRFHAFHKESLRVGFPETRQDRYRFVIENGDNPPLDITGIELEGNGYRLLFLAPDGRGYRVEYGSKRLQAPKYDTAVVLASLRQGDSPIDVRLGPQIANPEARSERDLHDLLGSPALLTVAILVMVGVLAWALFHASRQLKGESEPEV